MLPLVSDEAWENDRPPPTLIEDLLYENEVTIFGAATKTGKTYFALQALMSIAAGRPFLGRHGVTSRKPRQLYLSGELSAASVRDRMAAISRDTGLPMPVKGADFEVIAPTSDGSSPYIDLATEDGMQTYFDTLDAYGIQLVWVDTIKRFTLSAPENDTEVQARLWSVLVDAGREMGWTQAVIDHAGHRGLGSIAAHYLRGASAKADRVPTIVALARESKDGSGLWKYVSEGWHDPRADTFWIERPQTGDGELGAGFVPCDGPEPETPGPPQGSRRREARVFVLEQLEGGAEIVKARVWQLWQRHRGLKEGEEGFAAERMAFYRAVKDLMREGTVSEGDVGIRLS